MTRGTRIVNEVLHSEIIFFASTVATLLGFAVSIWPGTLNQWLFYIPLAAFIACVLYSFFVRLDNIALRDCARIIHALNHSYRDVLCAALKQNPNLSESDLPKIERDALEVACQRIGTLYFGLIGNAPRRVQDVSGVVFSNFAHIPGHQNGTD